MLYNIPYYKGGKDRDFGLKILSSIFDFKSGLSDEYLTTFFYVCDHDFS